MFSVPGPYVFKINDVVSLRIVKILIIKYDIYTYIFAEKATHIFFSINTSDLDILLTRTYNTSINTSDLDILLTRTANILTTNEFVKLTML